MITTCGSSDRLMFLRSWFGNPRKVASVSPSGSVLANLITQEISPSIGPIMELGAGTGVFTKALLGKGVNESDLTLVEYGSDFMKLLQQRFPKARVLWMDASQLAGHKLYANAVVGAVVSGLPMLTMPARRQIAVLSGAFTYIRPSGAFFQFTYSPRCPVPRSILDRLGLKATRIGGTIRNLPPASVYRITRRSPFRNSASMIVSI